MSTSIPHPPRRIPILGDVLGMDPARPNQRTLERFAELGPIYRRTILGTDLTFVGSAELAGQVFDEAVWEKHIGRPLEQLRPFVGDGLFTAYSWESNWAKAHEVLLPGFTKEAMTGYHDTMVDVVDQLCADLAQRPGHIPVVDQMAKLTLEVIGRCGFGHSFGSFTGDQDPFVPAMTRTLAFAQEAGIPLPFIGALTQRKARRQNRLDHELLTGTVDAVIAARQASGTRSPDLLDRMLHPHNDVHLDAANIRDQVLTFLVAGHETSVNTLSFALHFIAQHPEIAARMRAEAGEVRREGLRYEDVPRLRYTRQVINEALRLWPSAPGFFRAAKADTTLGGHPFKAGEWVFVLLLAVHRDPSWGPAGDEFDPEVFNPDRFAPAHSRGRGAEMFKPFGTGIRSCIGRQFALHEMTLALATLLLRFDITPEPGYELAVDETLTLRPSGLRLRFDAR